MPKTTLLQESPEAWELVFELAASFTGNSYTEGQKSGLLRNNVARRARQLGTESLEEYLEILSSDKSELPHFISATTIHTTSWFREFPHYQSIEEDLRSRLQSGESFKPFKMLCAACSTGQEAYSFALIFEALRRQFPNFEYQIHAFDIDPLSVQVGERGVYPLAGLTDEILGKYRFLLKIGKGRAEGYFAMPPEIRSRIQWSRKSILDINFQPKEVFDWIVCRNALIYFSPDQIRIAINSFKSLLKTEKSVLCLGHSDAIEPKQYGLTSLGRSRYRKSGSTKESSPDNSIQTKNPTPKPSATEKIKILAIDDSAVVREKLKKFLSAEGYSVSTVGSALEADEALKKESVDFITLDLQMPGENGIDWIRRQRGLGLKTPVVLVSDSTPADAPEILSVLGSQIQDYFEKKQLFSSGDALIEKIQALIGSKLSPDAEVKVDYSQANLRPRPNSKIDLIVIGASTGGTTALTELLYRYPKPTPPIVIVQHITSHFAKPFAERLAKESGLNFGKPEPGTILQPDTIYMSWADEHIGVHGDAGRLKITISNEGLISRHRPSVDFLFDSLAKMKHKVHALGILMTGMGADGAKGLLKLKEQGHWTICQDKDSCVVYGMPKEAIKLGAACSVGNITQIRMEMESITKLKRFETRSA